MIANQPNLVNLEFTDVFVMMIFLLMQDPNEMKKQLKEMEEEVLALREMQAKVEKEMGVIQGFTFLPLSFSSQS